MSYERGPQLEKKESAEERIGELTMQETDVIYSLPEERFEHLKKSGKLKKWLGVMTLTTAFSAFGGAKEAGAERRIDWYNIGRRIEMSYDSYSRREQDGLERAQREIEERLRDLDMEASEIVRKYNEEIKEAAEKGEHDRVNKLADELKEVLRPYQEENEALREGWDKIEKRLSKLRKIDAVKGIGLGILGEIGRY